MTIFHAILNKFVWKNKNLKKDTKCRINLNSEYEEKRKQFISDNKIL